MANYAPVRVTPEVAETLRAASFELSTILGRRITYGDTVRLALAALQQVDPLVLDKMIEWGVA